jgi:hypothetical protein
LRNSLEISLLRNIVEISPLRNIVEISPLRCLMWLVWEHSQVHYIGPRQYSSIQPLFWQVFGVASLGALPCPLYWSQTVQQYSTFGPTSVWCGQSGSTHRSIILVPDSTAVFNLSSDKCLVWLVWEHSQVHYNGPRQYSSIHPLVWQVFGVASLGALPGPLYWSQTVQQYSTFRLTSVWCG